jgi:hypothetical protein
MILSDSRRFLKDNVSYSTHNNLNKQPKIVSLGEGKNSASSANG